MFTFSNFLISQPFSKQFTSRWVGMEMMSCVSCSVSKEYPHSTEHQKPLYKCRVASVFQTPAFQTVSEMAKSIAFPSTTFFYLYYIFGVTMLCWSLLWFVGITAVEGSWLIPSLGCFILFGTMKVSLLEGFRSVSVVFGNDVCLWKEREVE